MEKEKKVVVDGWKKKMREDVDVADGEIHFVGKMKRVDILNGIL
jgi:hypothetical protein